MDSLYREPLWVREGATGYNEDELGAFDMVHAVSTVARRYLCGYRH